MLITGDDTADIHWASTKDVQKLIDARKFSEIDLPAVLMFLKDESDNMSEWGLRKRLWKSKEQIG